MTTPAEERKKLLTVTLNRRIFIAFIVVVAIIAGVNTWGTWANRSEAARLREDRRIFEALVEKVDRTQETTERADAQVRAVRDFSVCSFVLVLGLDLPQAEAERVVDACVDRAKFPPGPSPPPAVVPRQ